MEARHRALAEIALEAAGSYGLALAGGYAVRAHGMGSRPSGDVDALAAGGYTVQVVVRVDTFARLLVRLSAASEDVEPDKVELAADWRVHPPVMLAIGPVLHPDDAVANKMCALYGRALPRDFLDIDAVLVSGRYPRARLLELAANADAGFDPAIFACALGALTQITDTAFADYDIPPTDIAALRSRFALWRDELIG